MEKPTLRIFNHPRPKRSLLAHPAKKRKTDHKIEEINFDFDARADYLTGFQKRKAARAKQAKLEAEKKAREERIVIRKQVWPPKILPEPSSGGLWRRIWG